MLTGHIKVNINEPRYDVSLRENRYKHSLKEERRQLNIKLVIRFFKSWFTNLTRSTKEGQMEAFIKE